MWGRSASLDAVDLGVRGHTDPGCRTPTATPVERTPHTFTRREMFALGEYAETSHMREALLRDLAQ